MHELGRKFGIDRKTVSQILHRHDMPMRRGGPAAEQVEEAVRLHGAGWSTYKISMKLEADQGQCSDDWQSEKHQRGMRTGKNVSNPRPDAGDHVGTSAANHGNWPAWTISHPVQ